MRVSPWLLMIAVIGQQASAQAVCFTSYPDLTISEVIAPAGTVVLCEWVSSQKLPRTSTHNGQPGKPGRTIYKIVAILKDSQNTLKQDGKITLEFYWAGKPGDPALLVSSQTAGLEWEAPFPVTKTSYGYLKALPRHGVPWQERLAFFLTYLEDADKLLAEDAHLEFTKAPFEEIRKLSEKLPREKLRVWIADEKTAPAHLSLYGQMLGVCGEKEDAKLLADLINQPTKDFREGIDGIMAGYLLLTGEEGLKLLEDTKLKAGVKVPFSETYLAMLAVRFAWQHGESIPKERLKQSMRLLLDRPEVADLAIADLVRWKDWSIQDKLMAIYGKNEFDTPAVKRSIARYFLACRKDSAEDLDQNPKAEHAKIATKHLQTLREIDPETVKLAERFFYLN